MPIVRGPANRRVMTQEQTESDMSSEFDDLLLPAMPQDQVMLSADPFTQEISEPTQPAIIAQRNLDPSTVIVHDARQKYVAAPTPKSNVDYNIEELLKEVESDPVVQSTVAAAASRTPVERPVQRGSSKFVAAADRLDLGGMARQEQLRLANESKSPKRSASTWRENTLKQAKAERMKQRAMSSVEDKKVAAMDWTCPSCTSVNPIKNAHCRICGFAQPTAKTRRLSANQSARNRIVSLGTETKNEKKRKKSISQAAANPSVVCELYSLLFVCVDVHVRIGFVQNAR